MKHLKKLKLNNFDSSKSDILRLLILASNLKNVSFIKYKNLCDDVLYLIKALRLSNIKIIIKKNKLKIKGLTFKNNENNIYDAGSSGAVFRFLIPLFLKHFDDFKIKASDQLLKRNPLNSFLILFKENNITYTLKNNIFHIKGKIINSNVTLDLYETSQSASGFLLSFNNQLNYNFINFNASKSYYDYTLSKINQVNLLLKNNKKLIINSEIDYSNLAFYLVLFVKYPNIFNIKYNKIINKKTNQPDYQIFNLLDKIGISFLNHKKHLELKLNLKENITLNLSNNLDLVIPLVILSLHLNISIKFINLNNLIYKESNRLNALILFLNNIKASYKIENNNLILTKNINFKHNYEINNNIILDCYFDHRLIMGFTIFNLINNSKIKLVNNEGISKSSTFFNDNITIIKEYLNAKKIS